MNNRTITLSAIGAVLVIAVWWMFVFSPIKTESSDAAKEVDVAKAETRTLETQLSQLEDLEAKGAETQARLDQLRGAVPQQSDLAGYIDSANALAAETGVTWVSVTPAPPTVTGGIGTIQLSMVVKGGYYQVLDYLNRVEHMSRLVVIDGVTIDETGDENADEGGPSTLNATLNARMFSQAAATPTTSADGTTTPVAGGGGVAAPASGAQEN